MAVLDELSSDQKYAISKIIDGIIIMIEELYYKESSQKTPKSSA